VEDKHIPFYDSGVSFIISIDDAEPRLPKVTGKVSVPLSSVSGVSAVSVTVQKVL
jgi:hypothetical protein